MADRYENIRKALARVCDPGAHPKRYTQERYTQALTKLRLACDPDTIRELLAERDALAEGLSDTEKDVAVAQAVEFAEYVERQAKGAMREAARRFLSLPYSQEVAERLMERDALARRCEWQPIETAPQDGREFLSVANYTDEPRQVQIVDWDFVRQCQPGLYTHWMPLPEPPEAG